MSILYVFILCVKFIYLVKSDGIPCVFCGYAGTVANVSYTFSVGDVPNRCEAVIYGNSYFNITPPEADSKAIKELVAAKKIVYMLYTHEEKVNWTDIIKSPDPMALDKHIAPMIKYLKDNKVHGVLLAYIRILLGEVPDYAKIVYSMICKIKEGVPSIKVGLLISGASYFRYENKNFFDFTVTNPVVDLYIIDTSTIGTPCTDKTTQTGGRVPIKASGDETSLDMVTKASSKSPMDQSKVLIYLFDFASKVDAAGQYYARPYTEYCNRPKSELWCGDTMELFYKELKYAKPFFKGIMIAFLDTDDFDNTCGCGKFPVANTYIDAWEDKPLKCCPKI